MPSPDIWRARRESNPHQWLRRPSRYPLRYGRTFTVYYGAVISLRFSAARNVLLFGSEEWSFERARSSAVSTAVLQSLP